MRPLGSGRSISALVAGLRPHTLYHYRLVAISTGGTVVGADRTFKTGAKPPPAPRFSIAVIRGQSLSHALSHGLRVTFSCSRACQAFSSALRAHNQPSGIDAISITIARGSGRLRRGGTGQLTLHFSRAAARGLRGAGAITMLLSGVAMGEGGVASSPTGVLATLRH